VVRGIDLCDEWHGLVAILEDIPQADAGLCGFLPSLGCELGVGVKLEKAAFLTPKSPDGYYLADWCFRPTPKGFLGMSLKPACNKNGRLGIIRNESLDHGTCAFRAFHGFVCHISPRILPWNAGCHTQAIPRPRPSRRIESPQPFGSNRRMSLNLSRSRSKDAMRYPPFAARAANQASAKSTFLESNRFKASMTTSASAASTPAL
jgi:hypothetical protein